MSTTALVQFILYLGEQYLLGFDSDRFDVGTRDHIGAQYSPKNMQVQLQLYGRQWYLRPR